MGTSGPEHGIDRRAHDQGTSIVALLARAGGNAGLARSRRCGRGLVTAAQESQDRAVGKMRCHRQDDQGGASVRHSAAKESPAKKGEQEDLHDQVEKRTHRKTLPHSHARDQRKQNAAPETPVAEMNNHRQQDTNGYG